MADYDVRIISSLEKVFARKGVLAAPALQRLTAFRGQRVSFQAAYCFHGEYYVNQTTEQATRNPYCFVQVRADFPCPVVIRRVEQVPVLFPCEKRHDSEYLSEVPGLFPDILAPFDEGVQVIIEQWRALWIDCEVPADAPAGDHLVEVIFSDPSRRIVARASITLHVVPASLPRQRVIHTEWFYPDCLADHYGCEVFSERHWQIVEAFLRKAASRSVNMILTPLFTPALDTLIGKNRTTVQLVRIEKKGDGYLFDFSDLHRWISLCKEIGFDYFEMSHLFSQWGAKYPPKVDAVVNGEMQTIFGWHTPVETSDYPAFLTCFLPALLDELKKEDILDRTFFHVSDEPTIYNSDTYCKAKALVRSCIGSLPIIDALSHLELYQQGIVEKPVPTNDSIHSFLDAGLTDAWVYYCCAQGWRVSNRYIAMPAWRNRALGIQLYKYRMEGFLHWGYNFYNCQYSLHPIDPYRVNDGEDAFPAGDPFIVYPGPDGEPVESMRLPVLADAMADVQLLEWLERYIGRQAVLEMIEGELSSPVRFDEFPAGADYYLSLWEKAAAELEKHLPQQ